MDRRSGDNGPPLDDEFGWEEETVEARTLHPPAPPPAHGPPPAPRRTRRTFASDLRRLREQRLLPMLAALAVIIAVVVIIVVATRGDGESTAPAEVVPPTTSVTETATVTEQEPTEPVTTATEAPPAVSVSEDVTLRLGGEGAPVRALQRALAQLGFFTDEPDGIYGEQTQAAVQDFQESAGLPIDGTVGPQTASAINQALTQAG